MAIKPLPRSIPTNLPSARLHLDDISELCDLLKDRPGDWRVSFVAGDKVCESLEDLKELGGRTNRFSMSVSSSGKSRSLNITPYSTTINIYDYASEDKSKEWSTFARVEAIFRNRKLGVVDRLGPMMLLCAGLIVVGLMIHSHVAWRALITMPLCGALGYYIFPKIASPPSVVFLDYSHKVWTLRRFLEDQKSTIIVAILGAAIGVALKAIADKFLK
jgi:hypothetical protein